MRYMSPLLLAGLLSASLSATAEYCATGKITGTECSGIGIKSCGPVTIDAVEGKDGRMYEPAQCYEHVNEFSSGRCTLVTKRTGLGVISGLMSAASGPNFYTIKNGQYESVDVDYISFRCIKR